MMLPKTRFSWKRIRRRENQRLWDAAMRLRIAVAEDAIRDPRQVEMQFTAAEPPP